MKKLILASALFTGCTLGLQGLAFGHGGTYAGPGDTVPPGGGGGGGGGGPTSPGPSGPSAPGPSGPSTPSPSGPGSPGGAPSGPSSTGPTTGGGGGSATPDLNQWTFWWEFNKQPYINLKAAIHSGGPASGSGDFFLGHGEQNQAKDSLRPSEADIRQKVVPALLNALKTENNNDIVTGCLIALAKIGDEETSEDNESAFEKEIANFLKDSNQEISETAAVSLGILANPKSIPTLQQLVLDTPDGRKLVGQSTEVPYRTRAFACYALGLIGARAPLNEDRQKVAQLLWEVLQNDQARSRDVKVAALIALGLVKIDDKVLDPPAEGEKHPVSASRATLIDAVLTYLQNDEHEFLVRAHAPVTVARLAEGTESYEEHKAKVAKELLWRFDKKKSKEQNEVLQSCAIALGLLADSDQDELDKEIRKALLESDVSDLQTQYYTQIALAHAAGKRGDGEEGFLKGLEEVKKHLGKGLGSRKGDERAWYALAIGVLGDMLTDAGEVGKLNLEVQLRELLQDSKTPSEVGAYAIALGILKDLESEEPMLAKLREMREEEARGYLCVGLGLMNASAAIDEIQKIIKESKYRADLLKQAAIALGLLGDKKLVDDLIAMLQESTSLATQASLSTALGFIGDARSIDPLVQMLADKSITERARGFAAVALGIVADKEPLPWNTKIAVDLNYRASTETLNSQEGTGIINIL